MKEEGIVEEEVNRFFNIDEELLHNRVKLIRSELEGFVKSKRDLIPNNPKTEQELWTNKNFVEWNIANLILSKSDEDSGNDSFNRLIYFLYEEVQDIEGFVNLYSLQPSYNEGKLVGYNLIILEEK